MKSHVGRWAGMIALISGVSVLSIYLINVTGQRVAGASEVCTPADDIPPEPSVGPTIDGDVSAGDAIDIDELTYTVYRRGPTDDSDDVAYTVRLTDPKCLQSRWPESVVLDGALRREALTRTQECEAILGVIEHPETAPPDFDFGEAHKNTASVLCAGTSAQSVTPGGVPAPAAYPRRPAVSAIGWSTAFSSASANIVSGDTNGFEDVFVRDNHTYVNERASVSSAGAQGNNASLYPSISADGAYVTFASYATNLVTGDSNGALDVFVRSRAAGTTVLVSRSSAGVLGNGPSGATGTSMSADGRWVAFSSSATNLLDGIVSTPGAVYLRDTQSGTTSLVSRSITGAAVVGSSPAVSPDGRYVAYASASANIVPGDTNGKTDVFVFDVQASATQIVSTGLGGAPANGWSDFPTISAYGESLAFESVATNLTLDPPDPLTTGTPRQIFVADLVNGGISCISLNLQGQRDRSSSLGSMMSFSGRYVAFESQADDLVAGDTNIYTIGGPADLGTDIFLWDTDKSSLQIVDVDSSGVQGSGASHSAAVSPDGGVVAFTSTISTLVPGDTDLATDVFARRVFR